MKNILILALLCCYGILAAQGYRIGDIYTAPDGSQGVVYWLHPDNSGGWVVALEDSSLGCEWGNSNHVTGLNSQNPTYNQYLLNDTAGYNNTQIIRSYQNNNISYAAGLVDFAHGWVLPSPAQLSVLFAQLPFIANALSFAGGVYPTNTFYWTSAERDASSAWLVSLNGGYFAYYPKTSLYPVRAVRSFSYETESGYSYQWSTGDNTQDINVTPEQTTNYTVTVSTAVGSGTATRTIVVEEVSSSEFTISTETPYTWNDTTYYQSGDYTQTFVNAAGCDSVVTLHLTINYCMHNVEMETACESFEWHGMTYMTSGTFTYDYTNDEGCESTDTLHLTIIPMPTLNHTPDTVIQAGTSATLWASGADYIYWTDSNGSLLSSGSTLTINPLTNTTYYINGQNYSAGSNNLVSNGDFEQGNVGFISDYQALTSQYMSYGHYTITTDGYLHFLSSHLYGYNGTGQFMLVDGATTLNTVVWQQTVPVTPHTYYTFSAQVASTHHSNASGAYALLQFSVNSVQLGDVFHSPDVLNVWNPYYEVWYSGDNTSATLSILNQNTSLTGNDFGIDEISFSPLTECSVMDSIVVTVLQCDTSHLTVTTCESYLWYGDILTQSGDYTHSWPNELGCDSVVTLHLTIGPTPEVVITTIDTICVGNEVTLQAQILNSNALLPKFPVAIGDILCTDNSIVKPTDWPVVGKTAKGVVFYVDNTGEHGWAMHLQDQTTSVKWGDSQIDIPDVTTVTLDDITNDMEGYSNTQSIRATGAAQSYPAAWAVDFENGWYLPAAGQLSHMVYLIMFVNPTLILVEGQPLPIDGSFKYWSSTETGANFAVQIDHSNKAWGYNKQTGGARVRSICSF